jgi:hypothetical protein
MTLHSGMIRLAARLNNMSKRRMWNGGDRYKFRHRSIPIILGVGANTPMGTSEVTEVVSFTMGALALAKGTASFGLARATGTVASAEAER